jgi:hypothetical protein
MITEALKDVEKTNVTPEQEDLSGVKDEVINTQLNNLDTKVANPDRTYELIV